MFNLTTDSFLTEVEMDSLGIKYNLPTNSVGNARFHGSCAYDEYFNSLLHFGGRSWPQNTSETSILVYNLFYHRWEKWKGILDSPKTEQTLYFTTIYITLWVEWIIMKQNFKKSCNHLHQQY